MSFKYKKIQVIDIITILYIAFLGLITCFQNADSIFGAGETWIDSAVYKYVAWVIDLGGMPYRDAFDHKGPLLYLIFYLGRFFASFRGVWVVYVCYILAIYFFIYKFIRRFCVKELALFVVSIFFVMTFDYEIYWMSPELFSVLFLVCSLIIFIDYFLKQKISKSRLMICGFCFGCVCLLKIQMISVWIVFCLAVLVKSISEKRINKISYFILYFLIGFSIITIPIILWLINGGAFKDFINDYFVFNFLYTKEWSGTNQIENIIYKIKSFIFFFNKPFVLLSFILLVVKTFTEANERKFNIVYLIYFLVTLYFTSMTGKTYGHYGIQLLPVVIYPLSSSINRLKENKQLCSVLVVFCLTIYIFPVVLNKFDNTLNSYIKYANNTNVFPQQTRDLIEVIKNNSNMDDRIIIHGGSDYEYLYLKAERLAASRYSYQFSIYEVNKYYYDEYFNDLQKNPPKIIIAKTGFDKNRILNYIYSHNYEQIYETNDGNYTVYKLN